MTKARAAARDSRVALCLLVALSAMTLMAPSAAMVGGAEPAPETIGRSVVMILGSYGTACTGTAIAADLLLTAAHCVQPGADYKLYEAGAGGEPALKDVVRVERHPQFEIKKLFAHVATADVALLKLAEQLPAKIPPAALDGGDKPVAVGDALVVVGYGVTVRGDGRTGGTARVARLVVTGRPGTLQIRLVDPRSRGDSPGLGACAGDSGAPVFRDDGGRIAVIGVVSWSTGPKLSAGCGGLTGVTPLARYRAWILQAARSLGSPLGR